MNNRIRNILVALIVSVAALIIPGYQPSGISKAEQNLEAGVPEGTWRKCSLPEGQGQVTSLVTSPDYENDGMVYAGTSVGGVWWSLDYGNSWVRINNGLPSLLVRELVISPNYPQDKTLFVSLASKGVYRSRNRGQNWLYASHGLPVEGENILFSSLAISPNYAQDQQVFVGLQEEGQPTLYQSSTGGQSWTKRLRVNGGGTFRAIVLGPDYAQDPTQVWVLVNRGLLKLRAAAGTDWDFKKSPGSGTCFISLAVPTSSEVFVGVYASILGPRPYLSRSTDGGTTWKNILELGGEDVIWDIAVSPRYSQDHTLLIAYDYYHYWGSSLQGLKLTQDGGNTWSSLNEGLEDRTLRSAAIALVNDQYHIYAGTTTGIYQRVPTIKPVELSLGPIQVEEGDYPFPPNQIRLKVEVTNAGPGKALSTKVLFFNGDPDSGGSLIGERVIGSLPAGEVKEASCLWDLDGNLENATIYARPVCTNQAEGNAQAATVSQPLSVYYVDFRLDRDAYSFPNSMFGGIPYTRSTDGYIALLERYNLGSISLSRLKATILLPIAAEDEESPEGRCFGMACSSLIYWSHPPLKPALEPVYEYSFSEARPNIEWYQRGEALFKASKAWRGMVLIGRYSASDELNLLKFNLRRGYVGSLVIYTPTLPEPTDPAHAVVPYKLVQVGAENRVVMYDVNHPLPTLPTQSWGIFDIATNCFRYRGGTYEAYYHDPNDWGDIIISFFNYFLADWLERKVVSLFVGSPVTFLVEDQYGRTLSTGGGDVHNDIPGAVVTEWQGKVQCLLPADLRYVLEVEGTATGKMLIGISQPVSGDMVEQIIYSEVPVEPAWRARVSFYPGNMDRTMEASSGNRDPDEVVRVRFYRSYLPLLYIR